MTKRYFIVSGKLRLHQASFLVLMLRNIKIANLHVKGVFCIRIKALWMKSFSSLTGHYANWDSVRKNGELNCLNLILTVPFVFLYRMALTFDSINKLLSTTILRKQVEYNTALFLWYCLLCRVYKVVPTLQYAHVPMMLAFKWVEWAGRSCGVLFVLPFFFVDWNWLRVVS